MPAADDDLSLLVSAVREAGEVALAFFSSGARQWLKENDSPVTEADIAVDRLLHRRLTDARPGYGWLSEERADDPARLERRMVFIVDPIDGTRAFVDHEQGWVISAAVVEDGWPIAGVLLDPMGGQLWSARRGAGARLNGEPIAVGNRERLEGAHIASTRRAARTAGLKSLEGVIRRSYTKSLARRLALVAGGDFDAALASASARDWDLAAGALLVQEAGGRFSDLAGAPVRFNEPDTRHPPLVAAGTALHTAIIAAARSADMTPEASE